MINNKKTCLHSSHSFLEEVFHYLKVLQNALGVRRYHAHFSHLRILNFAVVRYFFDGLIFLESFFQSTFNSFKQIGYISCENVMNLTS